MTTTELWFRKVSDKEVRCYIRLERITFLKEEEEWSIWNENTIKDVESDRNRGEKGKERVQFL